MEYDDVSEHDDVKPVTRGRFKVTWAALAGCTLLVAACGKAGTLSEPASAPATGLSTSALSVLDNSAGCSTTAAAVVPPGANPQNLELSQFPAATAPAPGIAPMTLDDAVAVAHRIRARFGNGPAPDSAPTSAEATSYGAYVGRIQRTPDPFINPTRCIWLIHVHAPFQPKSAPMGATQASERYTVVVDVGTHHVLEIASS